MEINFYCTKPEFVPGFGTISTSWQNLRHVRIKRQLSYDYDDKYRSNKYNVGRDFDPYDYVDRNYRTYGSHSGYGHHSGYGSHSGYGHESYDHHDCCPLVVDPLILCALLGLIAAATYFLRIQITMNMNIVGRKRRRKRSFEIKHVGMKSSHDSPALLNSSDLNTTTSNPDESVKLSMPYFSNIFHEGKLNECS